MKFTKRTDLAQEFVGQNSNIDGVFITDYEIESLKITHIEVQSIAEKLLLKPCGNYYTIFTEEMQEINCEINVLCKILEGILPKGKCLVVGLGNSNITPDSLGSRTVANILSTAQFKELAEFEEMKLSDVCVIETGVFAQTGIETANQIKLIAKGINADFILAIDSLACGERERLGLTIQVTDTGITPGSGVGNNRTLLSKKNLQIPVIAIGVPMVMDLSAITGNSNDVMMITTRDIDAVVKHFAKVISAAVNKVLNPNLTSDDIQQLLF